MGVGLVPVSQGIGSSTPAFFTRRSVLVIVVRKEQVVFATPGWLFTFAAELACAGEIASVPCFVVALVHCVAVSTGPCIHKKEANQSLGTTPARVAVCHLGVSVKAGMHGWYARLRPLLRLRCRRKSPDTTGLRWFDSESRPQKDVARDRLPPEV